MSPQLSSRCRRSVLATAALVLGLSAAPSARAQVVSQMDGGVGYRQSGPPTPRSATAGGSQANASMGSSSTSGEQLPQVFEVVCPGGCYGGAFHPFGCRAYAGAGYYGFFRRYWGYGSYGPNYNMTPGVAPSCSGSVLEYVATRRGHGVSKHGGMDSCTGVCNGPGGNVAPAIEVSANSAHLQIVVPDNAEVLVEGVKTSTTGTTRDFVSPPLTPGKNLMYTIVVRHTNAGGKTVEESRTVRVRANDRLRLDCTTNAIKTVSTEGGTKE
jgi:uncharacterized protein (TIGR03000 family)